jgi:alpha-L-fucosidase
MELLFYLMQPFYPPQLQLSRDMNGLTTIEPLTHDFNWNPNGDNAARNINSGVEIYYTIDGSEPNRHSQKCSGPFLMASGKIKAVGISNDETGSVVTHEFGIIPKDWKLANTE